MAKTATSAPKIVTIIFLRRGDQILLAMKKRGFGAGKWNGAGGKVEPGESIEQAAIRECQEELGVTPLNPGQIGYLQFFMPGKPDFEHRCHVFVASEWQDEPAESEEMRPQWFATGAIPYEQMWPDDYLWLPHLLAEQKFEMIAYVTDTELVSYKLRLVEAIKGGDLRAELP